MAPRRILITSAIYPPNPGGPATFVPELARRLHRKGHRPEIVAAAPDCLPEREAFPVRKISQSLPTLLRLLWLAIELASRGRDADLFLVNTLELPTVWIAKLLGKPVVVKVVGDVVWERAARNGWTTLDIVRFQIAGCGWRGALLRRLYSSLYRSADRVVVPSRFLASLVEGWGVEPRRVRVVPNAVDEAFFQDASAANGPVLRLAVVARLVPWKGVDGILRALKDFPVPYRLDIMGDGPQLSSLSALATELGIAGRVAFRGARPRSEVAQLLREADIFILNSTYEGFPHVVLEAMASGCAVVATSAGGSPELLEDGINALAVKPADERSLALALRRLAEEPATRSRLAANGRTRARAFGWDRCVERLEAVLEEVG